MRKGIGFGLGLVVALSLLAPAGALGFGQISALGPSGSGAGQISIAIAVEVAPDGSVYVADFTNARVDVFASDGTFIRAFGKGVNPSGGDVCTTATGCQKGTENSSAGAIRRPVGIALDANGMVYVTSFENYRVDVFTLDGTFIRAFGKGVNPAGGDVCTTATGCLPGNGDGSAGSMRSPAGVTVSPAGLVYVADYASDRVDVFTPEGAFIRAFGRGVNPSGGDVCTAASGCQKGKEVEMAGGISVPFDVAAGAGGQIAVTDYNNRRINIFSTDGTFVRTFGKDVSPAGGDVCTASTGCKKGTETAAPGGFTGPSSIVVNGAGNLDIADFSSNRVAEYTFSGTFIHAFGEGVVDGTNAFQTCTLETGCKAGIASTKEGGLALPYGLAVDCRGAIYATTYPIAEKVLQVRRFGEPGTPAPPCPPPPGSGGSAQPASLSASTKQKRPKTAKPLITIELNPGSGTASLVVIVSDPGLLTLKGKGIHKVKKQAKQRGEVELLINPTAKVRSKLEEEGKATVKISLTFNPGEGGPIAQRKAVKLKLVRGF